MANHIRKKSAIKGPQLVPVSGRMVPRKANLNEIVREAAGLLPQHLNENIHVKMELAPECLPVMADKTGIGAVVVNLVKNAAEAMACGGTLTVSTKLVGSQACRDSLPGSSCALMSVTDTGVGMDKITVERMFEPYFTRKSGARRGLGLSIADSIIRKHNGCFKVESAVDRGTTIKLYLPLVRGETQKQDTVLPPRSFFGRGEGELADTA